MYGSAIAFSSVGAVASLGLPYFRMGSLDVGIPIQAFGVIVAAGVLIGAALLRRYAEWHGISDDHIRGLLGWITITGFIGAHWFDTFAYEPQKLHEVMNTWPPSKWPVLLRFWDGISSYGGFLGGAIGFAFYVWWKRVPVRLFADTAIVGLLPAFSIGRIGCTVVSDHVGAVVDKASWYAFLAMDYPRSGLNPDAKIIGKCLSTTDNFDPVQLAHNQQLCDGANAAQLGDTITMWNLGLVEFLYLVPVNLVLLKIAFNHKKRMPAGYIAVLAGVLYSPVRFFIDFLRPELTDPRHWGLTFAQWISILAFGAATIAALRMRGGKAADVVAPTAKEAQLKLKLLSKEEEEEREADLAKKDDGGKDKDKGKKARASSSDDDDDDDDEGEKPAAKKPAAKKDLSKPSEAKAEAKKPEAKTSEVKAEEKKPEAKASEAKAEEKKPEAKAEAKKPEAKAEEKKPEAKEEKAEAKAEDKKSEEKADEKKSDEQK